MNTREQIWLDAVNQYANEVIELQKQNAQLREARDRWIDAVNQLQSEIDALTTENAQLRAALENIAKCEGPYSRDELTHARNTIKNMAEIAEQALAAASPQGEQDNG